MTCWSCERATGDGATCGYCGAIQPPNSNLDYFEVLGLPRRYAMDSADAEQRFRELSRQVHPDRYAKADPRARRASLQRSVQLNEAWRALKDPIRRAEYLLRLAGHDVTAEEGRSPAGASPRLEAGQRHPARLVAPPALLGEILELREQLADARAESDDVRVQQLAGGVRRRLDDSLSRVAEIFGRLERVNAAATVGDEEYRTAGAELIAIRYYRRFLDEVAVHDEVVAAHDGGAALV